MSWPKVILLFVLGVFANIAIRKLIAIYRKPLANLPYDLLVIKSVPFSKADIALVVTNFGGQPYPTNIEAVITKPSDQLPIVTNWLADALMSVDRNLVGTEALLCGSNEWAPYYLKVCDLKILHIEETSDAAYLTFCYSKLQTVSDPNLDETLPTVRKMSGSK